MADTAVADIPAKKIKQRPGPKRKAAVADEEDTRSFGWCKDCSRERPLGSGNLVLLAHHAFAGRVSYICPGSGQPAGVAPEQDTDDTITEMAYHDAGGSSTQTLWGS